MEADFRDDHTGRGATLLFNRLRDRTAQACDENSLLDGAPLGVRARDALRLATPAAGATMLTARLREGNGVVAVARARLLAVDHGPEGRGYAPGGEALLGTPAAAERLALDGRDVTPRLDGSGTPLFAGPGSTLTIELPTPSSGLVLDWHEFNAPADEPSGATLDASDGAGGWQAIGHLRHPRADHR